MPPQQYFITSNLTNQLPNVPKLKSFRLYGPFTFLDYDAYWNFIQANPTIVKLDFFMYHIVIFAQMKESFINAFPNAEPKEILNFSNNGYAGEEFLLENTTVGLWYKI